VTTIRDIEPTQLWTYFEQICHIPRLSKKESGILDFIIRFAQANQLEYKKDEAGNIVIKKGATPGFENRQTVILQSHMDMVGEREQEVVHDFEKDPIKPIIEKDWIRAEGTTLGADDGIGMAAQFVVLSEKKIDHGPIECLFTVDEESGMTGASALQPGFIDGRILLNLDSEDEGELFIGCAGGIDTVGIFRGSTKRIKDSHSCYKVTVSGLNGGHSGDEIHKSPANAIRILNRFLWNVSNEFNARINRLEGGSLRNSIPREAYAVVAIPAKYVSGFESFYHIFSATLTKELQCSEPQLSFDLQVVPTVDFVISRKLQNNLLHALYACPHGVITWSCKFSNLVETSTNLAMVRMTDKNEFQVITSQRSSVDSAKKDIADRIRSIFLLAGAKTEHSNNYPGWTPDTGSKILGITEAAYRRLFRKDPVIRVIHAGLECGLIREKHPDLDMISFGPTIKGAHTPTERISIRSTQRFWKLLLDILKQIPENY
jgi:dipeptidase D